MAVDYKRAFSPFLISEYAAEGGDIESFCPAHEDPATSKKPSARLNFETKPVRGSGGIWTCFVCKPIGSDAYIKNLYKTYQARRESGWEPGDGHNVGGERVVNFQMFKDAKASSTAAEEGTRPKRKLPTDETLTDWTANLLGNEPKIGWLRERRGYTDDTIRKWGLGWSPADRRYSIPVRDLDGGLVNVRLYRPESEAGKMIWLTKGSSPQSLFGFEHISVKTAELFLFEGETDAILADQDGLPAVTHTAGAATFLPGWARSFRDKHVFICYDNDESGRKGRETAAKRLAETAAGVYFVDLPDAGDDYTDFRVKRGRSASDFRELVDLARMRPRFLRKERGKLPESGDLVTVEESQNADRNGRPLELAASITGKTEPAYSLPRDVVYNCGRDKGNVCRVCPMETLYDGEYKKRFEQDDELLMRSIDVTDERLRKLLREEIGARCSDMLQISVDRSWSVEHLVVTDSIERQRELAGMPVTRDVYAFGSYNTQVNTTVKIVGKQTADPRDQRGLFTSWSLEPVQTALDQFELTADLADGLKVFQPSDGQSPLDRMYEIADDLASNVTHIYGRGDLHVAYDLAWHSVLGLRFLGSAIDKGWLEIAVMGDSRTGKSEIAKQLTRHYNSGAIYSCDQASLAGLVGGVQQPTGKSWHVAWGAIPLNDRRLIVLDESQSLLDKGVIEHLSSIRSSGVAQITKIKNAQTTARTRLVWIANPPSGSQISALPDGGMDGLRQLMPNHEDIARFDFALAAVRDEVPADLINARTHAAVPHEATSELAGALVTWAWSRTPDQIRWDEGAEQAVLDAATDLGARYTSDFPLIQAENVRVKVARISAAIAARTFSIGDTPEILLVTEEHVDDAVRYLDRIYKADSFGYGRMSRRVLRDTAAAKTNIGGARDYLTGQSSVPDHNGGAVAKGLRSVGGRFESRALGEAASLSTEDIANVLRWAEDMKLIRRVRGGRYIEPARVLIDLLRELEDEEMNGKPRKARRMTAKKRRVTPSPPEE